MNKERLFSCIYLIIGVLCLFGYHNNVCGNYWQVGLLASGIVSIAWSVKVI